MSPEAAANAPKGCIWAKQVRHSLEWMVCFLSGIPGSWVRRFAVEAYARTGDNVEIVPDASP